CYSSCSFSCVFVFSLASSFIFFYSYRHHRHLHSFPTRRSSDLIKEPMILIRDINRFSGPWWANSAMSNRSETSLLIIWPELLLRSEEHTSELQSRFDLVCRLLLEKKKNTEGTLHERTRLDTIQM